MVIAGNREMKEKYKQIIKDKKLVGYIVVNVMSMVALLSEFIFFQYGILKIVRYLILAEALFIIAWKDKKEHIILNKHLVILLFIRIFLILCEWLTYPEYGMSILISAAMGMLMSALVFGLCYLLSRGGMGAGDVKLMIVLGLYVGGSVIMQIMILSVIASAIYSIVNLIRKKTSLKAEIPFAPFVLIGTILAMALGV